MEEVQEKIQNLEIEDKQEEQQNSEQQTKLTPNQLKKLKQKQKKAQKKEQEKQEQEEKQQEVQDENNKSDQKQDSFEQELQWCIKQLKLGLVNNNLDKDQIKESTKVISKLESNTVLLVEKRHLMRVIFGDYRKLMKMIK
ncbi:hypothetical protein TTHERM_00193240 (macronuclear) [Tetrahymena thermophila SB210]|uniref:Uncharacterized protein n=1 Tax=Tetrahymena thermophila (strain SB210) TaxID=312017 RepID=Q23KL1_TETTS|nr:hypothetical protein TTHERM_00193240 [Tetrahymena thermophila SB210]EAR96832.1 hypothetical protein TTHERM_00193240 [Tetrahymena thermophila SB210]|eukprot:XP_001017077.1 hypothetical protein TTHERM_00193240 [Tetrahymena thermophila SB210]